MVKPSENLTSQIKRILEHSDEVVFLVTESSLNHPSAIAYEVGVAESLEIPITPIVVNVEDKRIPAVFADLPTVKWSSVRDYLDELEQRMQQEPLKEHGAKSISKHERKQAKKVNP